MIKAQIELEDPKKELFTLFDLEDRAFKNKRADYHPVFDDKKNLTILNIKAKDPTALKSVMSSIIKIIYVYEEIGSGLKVEK